MLTALSWPQEVIDRVCYLVGHHHTYDNIDGMDYQILVEADFLVNLFEDGSTRYAEKRIYPDFRTEGGKRLFRLSSRAEKTKNKPPGPNGAGRTTIESKRKESMMIERNRYFQESAWRRSMHSMRPPSQHVRKSRFP